MRKVLILTEQQGWHFNQLQESFLKNQIKAETCNLTDISLSIIHTAISKGLSDYIPDFDPSNITKIITKNEERRF